MTESRRAMLTGIYGVWLAIGGIWRFIQAGSKPALGFGLTTSVMSLIGAALLNKGKRTAGTVVMVITLLFVIGFYLTKSAKEGLDIRVAITLFTSILECVVLAVRAPARDSA